MSYVIGSGIIAVMAVACFFIAKGLRTDGELGSTGKILLYVVAVIMACGSLMLLFASSFTHVGQDEVGHLHRVYLGESMPAGQIVALDGQNGPQARTLAPGFHIIPFLKVMYNVESFKVITIEDNQYGFVVAADGKPLRPNQFLADAWPQDQFEQMLNAEYFLAHGGQKGPQLTVLPPGTYRYNHYLFHINSEIATNIAIGFVGVVKSNVQEAIECTAIVYDQSGGALAVPLVPKGCIGVWNDPLQPGRYYLNRHAYEVTDITTRAQAWEYKGGYTRHFIDLRVDQEGKITQVERREEIPIPPDAADPAVSVRVESWIVPLELRVIAQVSSKDAPFVVASVGGLKDVEDKILTPTIRSVVRNIVGSDKREVLDLQNKRGELETLVEEAIIPEGRKAGVSIKEVRFGDPIIPPELLVAIQRNQLALQLQLTYRQEKVAQDERIKTEQARASADQQPRLVEAQINVKVAEQQVDVARQQKIALQLRGEGREAELTAIARGQAAQVKVLGEDRVMQLEALQKTLDAAVANPEIVKVPQIMVEGGDGTNLAGFAAVLGGASNIAKGSSPLNPDHQLKK